MVFILFHSRFQIKTVVISIGIQPVNSRGGGGGDGHTKVLWQVSLKNTNDSICSISAAFNIKHGDKEWIIVRFTRQDFILPFSVCDGIEKPWIICKASNCGTKLVVKCKFKGWISLV